MSIMNITLGSTSVHKIKAVMLACDQLGIEAAVSQFKTSTGQNEQPVGFDETYGGAFARAMAAKMSAPQTTAIGIESGIICFGKTKRITFDLAVVVIFAKDYREIISTSQGIIFPEEYVQIAEERSFVTTTVGSIIANELGGDATDPHSILTGGKVTRTETLVDALKIALKQI